MRSTLLIAESLFEGDEDPRFVAALERAFNADPTSEDLARALMRSLIRSGQHAEALRIYRRLREMLSVVLGVDARARDRTVETTDSRRSECGHRIDDTGLELGARPLKTGRTTMATTRPTWEVFKAQLDAAIQEVVDAQNELTDAQAKLAEAQTQSARSE